MKEDCNSAFAYGQFLKALDEIHTCYKRVFHIRGGILIGADMYEALKHFTPGEVIVKFSDKMMEYISWAQTSSSGTKYGGIARWCLDQIGNFCSEIDTEWVNQKISSTDLATIGLGYMSKLKTNDPDLAEDLIKEPDDGEEIIAPPEE